MATYNGEKYIQQQLDSFLQQTVLPDELIVCDDCSNDNTLDIIEDFKKKASFDVKVLKNEKNSGYIKNFAKVILATKGDYVFLCDQDDVWFPNKIEMVIKAFKEQPMAQMVAHNAICTDSELKSLGKTLYDFDVLSGEKYGSALHGFATCVKRNFLDYALPIPECYTFDNWFYTLATGLDVRYRIDTPLGYYRRHKTAITFSMIGENHNFLNKLKNKISKNIDSLFKARSTKEMDYNYERKKNFLKFIVKVYENRDSLEWINNENIIKLKQNIEELVNAYDLRYEALSENGIKRFNKILECYKKNAYKRFHGFRTAIDDFLR